MEPDNPRVANRVLLILAACGLLWWAVDAWLAAFPWRDGDVYSLASALILVVAVAGIVAIFLRRGGLALLRNPVLLVPFGVLALARHLLGLTIAISFLTAGFSLSLLSISTRISAYLLIAITLEIAYAAWMSRVLLGQRDSGRADLVVPAPILIRDFLRAALFMTVGVLGLMIPAGAAITWIGGSAIIWLLPIWCVIWNGLTVAFLPVALTAPNAVVGFRSAFAASRSKALWGIVLLHLAVIGIVVYFHVSGVTVTESTTRSNGNTTHTTNTESWTRSGTYTEAVWTGGYESGFRWHDKLMANIVKSRSWPPATFALGLLAAALAIIVKIEVIRRLPLGTRDPPADNSV